MFLRVNIPINFERSEIPDLLTPKLSSLSITIFEEAGTIFLS